MDEARREKKRAYCAAWRAANREQQSALSKAWYAANLEKTKAATRAWQRANPGKVNAKKQRRRAHKLKATPAWADLRLVRDMYEEAEYQGLTVDHMVPLKSPVVCGLHWEGNLQLLAMVENSRKGNRLEPAFASGVDNMTTHWHTANISR